MIAADGGAGERLGPELANHVGSREGGHSSQPIQALACRRRVNLRRLEALTIPALGGLHCSTIIHAGGLRGGAGQGYGGEGKKTLAGSGLVRKNLCHSYTDGG